METKITTYSIFNINLNYTFNNFNLANYNLEFQLRLVIQSFCKLVIKTHITFEENKLYIYFCTIFVQYTFKTKSIPNKYKVL